MPDGLKTITYPVRDLAAATATYRTLFGADPYIDEPYYVAFSVAGTDVGLDPNGHDKGMTAPVPYWHVTDIEAKIAELVDAGATKTTDPQDVGGGNLIATLADADGNPIGLMQAA